MNDNAKKIQDAELEVMQALWKAEGPVPLIDIRRQLSAKCGWEDSTVKTLLRRLCAKGAVGQEKDGVFRYRPLVSRAAVGGSRARRLIDKLYAGSARDMVAALVAGEELGREDIAQLRALLEELDGKGGG